MADYPPDQPRIGNPSSPQPRIPKPDPLVPPQQENQRQGEQHEQANQKPGNGVAEIQGVADGKAFFHDQGGTPGRGALPSLAVGEPWSAAA